MPMAAFSGNPEENVKVPISRSNMEVYFARKIFEKSETFASNCE